MSFSQGGFRNTRANGDAFGNFPLVDEGEYLVVVKRREDVTSSGGNDMVKVRYGILNEGKWLGKIIFDQIVFCEAMAGRNKHVLKVLEQPFQEGPDDEDFVVDSKNWIGKQLRVVVIHEVYNEKTRAKVSQYLYKDAESEAAAHPKKKPGNAPAPAAKLKEETAKPKDDPEFPEAATVDGEEIPF